MSTNQNKTEYVFCTDCKNMSFVTKCINCASTAMLDEDYCDNCPCKSCDCEEPEEMIELSSRPKYTKD